MSNKNACSSLTRMVMAMFVFAALGLTTSVRADEPEAWIEIFRLAPGKHEEFMRGVARDDEVLKAGGQPPTQVFLHQEGAEWDVLLLKPVPKIKPTAAQDAAMAAKAKELGVPSGAAYWVWVRGLMASHTDTKVIGPLVASEWLARLDALRAAAKSNK